MNQRLQRACTVALLAPLCAATAIVVWVSAGERAGAAPLSGLVPRNSAEAAGLGRAADVLRFLRSGDDPRRVYPVRPEIISSAVLQATTLEAAMWSRQLEMIQLLEREGVLGDQHERRALACLAADLRVEDVVEYLAPEGDAYCEAGKAFERVLAHPRERNR